MLSEDFFNIGKELRQGIISQKPLQHMKNLLKNIPKDEVVKIINCYPGNQQSHLTLLNLSFHFRRRIATKYSEFLLANGANPNLEFKQSSEMLFNNEMICTKTMTPIMFQSRIGNVKNVDLLIKYGADIYKKDKNGKNSIDHAIEGKNIEVIRKLKKKKMMDYSRIAMIFYNISNLNNDCIQNIVSFCF
jgi:ankyrin repeat protein